MWIKKHNNLKKLSFTVISKIADTSFHPKKALTP